MALVEQELFNVLEGFALLRPINLLKWPLSVSLARIHEFFLHTILFNSHFSLYPPSAQYQRKFWKWVIENLERTQQELQPEIDEFEIDQGLYGHYLKLISVSGSYAESPFLNNGASSGRGLPLVRCPPSDCYVTRYWRFKSREPPDLYHYKDQTFVRISDFKTITLLESRNMIERGTTGLKTWRAGHVLAQYLTNNPSVVVGRRVLELGSGIGFLGIVVASLQLRYKASSGENNLGSIYLTDINEEVISRCQENILLPCNSLTTHPNIRVQMLDWFASLEENQKCILRSRLDGCIKPNIILGADIVFDPSFIPALVGVLKVALSCISNGGVDHPSECALIALTVRNQATIDAFRRNVQEANLCISELAAITEQNGLDDEPGGQNNVLLRITAE